MHFDVIIVGAGVTGSSLSLNLSKEGLSVGLLDYKNPYGVSKRVTSLMEEPQP